MADLGCRRFNRSREKFLFVRYLSRGRDFGSVRVVSEYLAKSEIDFRRSQILGTEPFSDIPMDELFKRIVVDAEEKVIGVAGWTCRYEGGIRDSEILADQFLPRERDFEFVGESSNVGMEKGCKPERLHRLSKQGVMFLVADKPFRAVFVADAYAGFHHQQGCEGEPGRFGGGVAPVDHRGELGFQFFPLIDQFRRAVLFLREMTAKAPDARLKMVVIHAYIAYRARTVGLTHL